MNKSLTFVTVKWGTKYAADYVNILHDMVRRSLPTHYDFSFICFTDDPSGILSHIEARPLPQGLTGWWNKLYLFKRGVIPDGTRVFYLDLDTAITGDPSDFIAYQGMFAILRDFYRPNGYGSGVMLWRGGFGHSIWESYEEAGHPDISGGDQAWIERCKPKADILQDLFPGMIVSFKEKAQLALPAGVKIVCFHGLPRPHQVKNGWVEKVWRIGGDTPAVPETPAAQPLENVRHAVTLPFPWLDTLMPADSSRHVCIVGGGASAAGLIEEIRQRKQEGKIIWALNGAFRHLTDNGIDPDAHVMFAANRQRAAQVPGQTKAMLFYASQCDPEVFAKAARHAQRVIMWHALSDGIGDLIGQRRAVFIGGGGTTGIKAIGLAQTLGFGNIHLYGFDSSYPVDAANDERIEVEIDGQFFASSPRLAQQVSDFRIIRQALMPKGIKLSVHGDGLLSYVARKLERIGGK